jgi:hypothetical protein
MSSKLICWHPRETSSLRSVYLLLTGTVTTTVNESHSYNSERTKVFCHRCRYSVGTSTVVVVVQCRIPGNLVPMLPMYARRSADGFTCDWSSVVVSRPDIISKVTSHNTSYYRQQPLLQPGRGQVVRIL